MIEGTTSGQDRASTRKKLIMAAQRLFTQEDYGAVTLSGVARAAGFTSPIGVQHFKKVEVLFAEVYLAHSDAETLAIGACFNRAAAAMSEVCDDTAREKLQEAAEDLINFYRLRCRIRSGASAYRRWYPVIQKAYSAAFDRRLTAAQNSAPAFYSCADSEQSGILAEIEAIAQLIAAPFGSIDLDDKRQKMFKLLQRAVAEEPDHDAPQWSDEEPLDGDGTSNSAEPSDGDEQSPDEEPRTDSDPGHEEEDPTF